ncbi:hypothetical protein [Pseudomonas rhodesiae]|uniref:hypothetical protein n=1 Tax=Pseudomonas rhodesiae TaxID=76760 RepID=UPI001F1D6F87|nr:hypothetical protein [Pseudomonas rhodesiae]
MNQVIDSKSPSFNKKPFYLVEVFDGRGVYGFGLGLTDERVARDLLKTLGRDLLGRITKLHTLANPPEEARGYQKHRQFTEQTQRIKALIDMCANEPSPGRAFLVAFVQQHRAAMPLSHMASMLEHAKYEPDFDEFAYIPLHQSAIGRAYP